MGAYAVAYAASKPVTMMMTTMITSSLRGIKACDDDDEGAGITPGNGQGIGLSVKILGFQGLGFLRKLLVDVLLL